MCAPELKAVEDKSKSKKDKQGFMDEISRQINSARRESKQCRGDDGGDGPEPSANSKDQGNGADPEHDWQHSQGARGGAFTAEEKIIDAADQQRKVIKGGTMIVSWVIVVHAMTEQVEQKKPVYAFIMMKRFQREIVDAKRGSDSNNQIGRG